MKEQRVIYLDAVRGIAAIAVVLYHYLLSFYPALFRLNYKYSHTTNNFESLIALTPISILYNGSFAVCVFFVLSGYVLSLRFFRDNNLESVYSGAFKRYFRLGIPIFFSVLLSYLLLISKAYYNVEAASDTLCTFWLSNLWNTPLNFLDMLYEGIYRVIFKGGNSEFNPVLWTMNLEFFGSLLVFAFLALVGNLRNRFLIYLVLIFLFRDSYFLAFFFGIILCDYFNSTNKIRIHWTIKLIVALLALYLSSYQEFETQNMWSILDGLFLHTRQTLSIIGAFLFLLVVLNSSRIKIVLSKRLFHYLGNISFSIYLLHILVLCSISSYLFELFKNEFLWSYHLSFIAMLLISIVIVWASSHIFYKLIDKNGMKFSGYLYNKFFQRKVE